MKDIEYHFTRHVAARVSANPRETAEDIERKLLDGNMFDPDEPYIMDLASRVMDGLEEDGKLLR